MHPQFKEDGQHCGSLESDSNREMPHRISLRGYFVNIYFYRLSETS